jgi:hypothetical protein
LSIITLLDGRQKTTEATSMAPQAAEAWEVPALLSRALRS